MTLTTNCVFVSCHHNQDFSNIHSQHSDDIIYELVYTAEVAISSATRTKGLLHVIIFEIRELFT